MSKQPMVQIDFGALAEPLEKQLEAQGMRFWNPPDAKMFQSDCDALTRCAVRSLLGEGLVRRARQRLLNRIAKQTVRKEVPR